MNFAFYKKSDFEKKPISLRIMTSHQTGSSQNDANFENIENLLKLTIDKFCEKFLKFREQQIIFLY